jgi:hypothetical protein
MVALNETIFKSSGSAWAALASLRIFFVVGLLHAVGEPGDWHGEEGVEDGERDNQGGHREERGIVGAERDLLPCGVDSALCDSAANGRREHSHFTATWRGGIELPHRNACQAGGEGILNPHLTATRG